MIHNAPSDLNPAIEVMHDYNECTETSMQYDKVYDQFYILDKESDEFEVWDDITNYEIENIARGIENFIWEFDTYHYQDECIDRMQTVDSIIAQLKDFNTLKQAIRIFYNDDLTEELKFEKLGGILRV